MALTRVGRGQSRARGQALAGARPRQRAARALGLAALLTLVGCDPHFVDIIALADAGASVASDAGDPCAALSADQCAADTQDGCSLQPNPTGCTSGNASCGAGRCASGDPFVRRSGEALFLHGAPFSFVGSVSYGIAWADNGCQICAYSSQSAALGPTFDELATMHTNVLRVWAYQSYAGASGKDFSHFDRLVAAARAAGVRLIPVLENMYGDCSSGGMRDDAWFTSGYKSPYGNYALSYRDYVAALVAHFSSEPTIMAWELFHEAGGDQFAALDGFAADMTALIRGSDTNHLIALGLNDGDTGATSSDGDGSNYFKLQNRAEVDLVDVQDFNAPSEPEPAQVARCRAIARTLGKVAFIGASAAKLSDASSGALKVRASQIESKLQAAFSDGFRGYLVYDYAPKWQSASYDFDSRAEEPLAGASGILAQHSPRY